MATSWLGTFGEFSIWFYLVTIPIVGLILLLIAFAMWRYQRDWVTVSGKVTSVDQCEGGTCVRVEYELGGAPVQRVLQRLGSVDVQTGDGVRLCVSPEGDVFLRECMSRNVRMGVVLAIVAVCALMGVVWGFHWVNR